MMVGTECACAQQITLAQASIHALDEGRACPLLQGRFSGRLARKEDEAQLVVECALLGPLLGDTQPATLSTIVRSIASGRVRKYLETHLPRDHGAGAPGGGGGVDAAADLQVCACVGV